ncbi:hypothetical protein OAC89_01660 [Deltaproteobacteria bacterium]|nr:hypothetical protein [Deltaproteobacteria bacterium]
MGPKRNNISHFQTPSLLPSGIRCEFRHFLKRKAFKKWLYKTIQILVLLPVLPFYLLEKIILNLDEGVSWFLCAAVKGISLCGEYRPEAVYSTGGTASAHLAGFIVSRYTSIPWIAEFQDPLIHDDWLGSKREYLFANWLEKLVCKNASAVIFLTEAAKESSRKRTGLGNKGHVIYPGSGTELFPKVIYRKRSAFHFAHFGSLAGSRNPEVFFEALYQFLLSEPQLRNIIKVDLYGTCDNRTHNLIRHFEYRDVIAYHGKLPRNKSLSLMAASDCLLLIQNTQAFSSETIPSKVYEYLFTNRPVLGLVHKNPELEQMLLNQGHWVALADDVESVLKGMKSIISRFHINDNQENFPEPLWTIEKAVSRLITIAEVLHLEK